MNLTAIFSARCIARENNVVGTLPPRHLVRLSANLSRIIELSMDGDESGFDTNVSIVWPWRLLYRLAKRYAIPGNFFCFDT